MKEENPLSALTLLRSIEPSRDTIEEIRKKIERHIGHYK